MKPQIYFAVYDSSEDADYYSFEFMYEAIAEVEEWIVRGLDTDLSDPDGRWCAEWGRLYVCSVDEDMVPNREDDPDCVWCLWDFDDTAIRYRDIFSSWGDHGMVNIGC